MSTSAAAAAGTVRFYCQDCSARFSLPAPPSPFDFTLCPRCRRGYLDDCPAPNPLPLWPSSPPSPSSPPAMLPPPPPRPPWIPSWSSSSSATPPPPPPPLPWPSSPPSPSLPSAMLPPPPPFSWIPSSSSFSSATKKPPPPPPPCVPSSSASSSLRTTLSRTPPSPCTRASSSSTGLPPPPPPTTSSGTTTSSAAPVPYYCPKHFAVATRKEPPFPLFTLERCPNCRVHDFHEDAEHPVSSSTTASPISSAYSSASSSPLWLPPPPPPPELYRGELQPGSLPLTMERADFVDDNVELQPAPTAWTSRLPVVTVTVADNEVLCAHCTSPILRRGRLLPCGHQYHASCIMPWLLRRNSCPVWDCQCSLQGSPPPSPPRPQPQPPSSHLDYFFDHFPGPAPSLTSMPSNTWDYFFSPSAEERAPQHRSGLQSAPRTLPLPPPPVSIYAPLINSPVHRGGSQAAPAASIAALPTVTVSDTAEVCAVCTEPLPLAAAARRLPCGHLYHSDCIVPWLSRHNSCPVCRRSIPMFPSPTAETSPSPSPSPSLPQPTPGRRRSLPGARRIRRICHRLLRYMGISRAHQPNRSGNIVHG